jgi:hypothetical protein
VLAGLLVGLSLAATAHASHQDDAGIGGDAPDERGDDAPRLDSYRAYEGELGLLEPDARDWYTIDADEGDRVWLALRAQAACVSLHAPDGTELDTVCSQTGNHPAPVIHRASTDGVYHVEVYGQVHHRPQGEQATVPQTYRLGTGVDEPAPSLREPALPPALPGEGDGCPKAPPHEAEANRGTGDPSLDGLRWAATKTGYRAAIAFDAEGAEEATIRYHVDGGPQRSQTMPTPAADHLAVLERLPTGHALCFQVTTTGPGGSTTSAWHGLRLVNGPTAYDAEAEAYTLNLVAAADSSSASRATLQKGLDHAADDLREASDGHVRLGTVLLAFGETPPAEAGPLTCLYVRSAPPEAPACRGVADVVVGATASPTAAAETTLDGLVVPYATITMAKAVTATDAPGLASTRDLGAAFGDTLVHEVGHYAFGMPHPHEGESCPGSSGVSVMTPDTFRTEFDGPNAPCPERADDPGYVPSWTHLRDRYPEVPARPDGPVRGPEGPGEAYRLHVLGPDDAGAPGPDLQDDAGSGADAPRELVPSVPVETGVRYDGTLGGTVVDNADAFAVEGEAGQELSVRFHAPGPAFVTVRTDRGSALDPPTWPLLAWPVDVVNTVPAGTITVEPDRIELPTDGTYYVTVQGFAYTAATTYAFSLALDGDPPPLGAP